LSHCCPTRCETSKLLILHGDMATVSRRGRWGRHRFQIKKSPCNAGFPDGPPFIRRILDRKDHLPMTKTLRWLFVLVGFLLFALGLLLGQQMQRSKFEKYLHPAAVTPMELSLLRANVDLLRSFTPATQITGLFEVPTIFFDSSCACFTARTVVTTDLMKAPLDQVRGNMMATVDLARRSLRFEFPELLKDEKVPERDLKMTFFELNFKTPDASHEIAEYADGKIVFK
jgi:hypothetical protein